MCSSTQLNTKTRFTSLDSLLYPSLFSVKFHFHQSFYLKWIDFWILSLCLFVCLSLWLSILSVSLLSSPPFSCLYWRPIICKVEVQPCPFNRTKQSLNISIDFDFIEDRREQKKRQRKDTNKQTNKEKRRKRRENKSSEKVKQRQPKRSEKLIVPVLIFTQGKRKFSWDLSVLKVNKVEQRNWLYLVSLKFNFQREKSWDLSVFRAQELIVPSLYKNVIYVRVKLRSFCVHRQTKLNKTKQNKTKQNTTFLCGN